MPAAPARRALVVGIGNPDRGDDAAGRLAAGWLAGRLPPDADLVGHDGEVASLTALIEGASDIFMIDACASGAPAGTIRRFDVCAEPLPADTFAMSTHGLGLAQAIELARALGSLPERCVVYAIEGGTFEPGAPPSPAVVAAVEEVGRRLLDEIRQAGCGTSTMRSAG